MFSFTDRPVAFVRMLFFFSWTVEGLTSYCCGYEREKGRGRTTTHFFFSKDFTSRTLRSFVQLQTSGRRGQKTTRVRKRTGLDSRSYLCRALAVQYLRFLSGSLTWPSRQHWPQTNFIFRLRGRPLPAPPTSPPTPTPPTGPTPPATTPSPPPRPAMPPAGRLLPGWDMWIGWKRQRGFILLLQTIVLTHVTDLIHSTLIRMLSKFNKPKTFNHPQIIFFSSTLNWRWNMFKNHRYLKLNHTLCCFCEFCSSLCQCRLDSCTISSWVIPGDKHHTQWKK